MPTKLKFLYWWKLAWVKIGQKRIDFEWENGRVREWENWRMVELESWRIGEFAFLKNQKFILKIASQKQKVCRKNIEFERKFRRNDR